MSVQTEEYDISLFYETALKLTKQAGEVCYLNNVYYFNLLYSLFRLLKKLRLTEVN